MESRPPAQRSDRTAYDDVQGESRKNERRRRCRRRGNATKCDASDKKETNQFEGGVGAGEERRGTTETLVLTRQRADSDGKRQEDRRGSSEKVKTGGV